MALIKNFIPESQYPSKCPYDMTPKGICIHNTANDASAIQERNNVSRVNNTAEISFHIAIDDKEAIQLIPFNRNAWHAGDGTTGEGNRSYIGIEICYSLSGGDRFINAEKRSTKEVATLLKQYGWTLANVKKHQDFSGKYCPHRTLDMGWQRFLNMIQLEFNILNDNKPESNSPSNLYRVRKTWEDVKSQIGAYSNLDNAKREADRVSGYAVFNNNGNKIYPITVSEPTDNSNQPQSNTEEYIVKEYKEIGVFTCTVDSIYFRNKPIISNDNPIQGQYFRNQKVNYDYVVITNKYVYISWISASLGVIRYMPITDRISGEKWGYAV
ncbi:N-acetylmuramoyl-L-alanine amidase [Clostridium sp.]|uniref:N-acetylmuramoyl-L-alanine amidase n=1 Tax=Clostridium sp. TaxID=1506 RepID=UPI002638E241|nr:N-acetylmuramoyl-L-alanine amidase [Clostridium sp.]